EARGEASEAGLRHSRHTVLGSPLEVVAGREGALARAGENADPAVGIRREVVPHPLELLVRRRVEGVHHVGPVDGDARDVVLLLVDDEFEPHAVGHSAARRRLTGNDRLPNRARMPLEHRMMRTNGVRLHCVVSGEGPLVVLLHGFPECWYSWRHQIDALACRFRVVAPDLRGYNESEKPASVAAYAMPELVADVAGLVSAFGERDAAVVGHDWGGAIAWYLAMERPPPPPRPPALHLPHPPTLTPHPPRH